MCFSCREATLHCAMCEDRASRPARPADRGAHAWLIRCGHEFAAMPRSAIAGQLVGQPFPSPLIVVPMAESGSQPEPLQASLPSPLQKLLPRFLQGSPPGCGPHGHVRFERKTTATPLHVPAALFCLLPPARVLTPLLVPAVCMLARARMFTSALSFSTSETWHLNRLVPRPVPSSTWHLDRCVPRPPSCRPGCVPARVLCSSAPRPVRCRYVPVLVLCTCGRAP